MAIAPDCADSVMGEAGEGNVGHLKFTRDVILQFAEQYGRKRDRHRPVITHHGAVPPDDVVAYPVLGFAIRIPEVWPSVGKIATRNCSGH